MRSIFTLFGHSPFAPLRAHMEKVAECVDMLPKLFQALEQKNQALVEQIAEEISKLEHNADLAKNDIRNHLPTTLFLPIDRGTLLDILTLQDSIADKTEDIGVLISLKPLQFLDLFQKEFQALLDKNLEAFHGALKIIHELHELLESSFGGVEAEKVRAMVHQVAFQEHEADLLQRVLLRKLYQVDGEMPYTDFFLWQRIVEALASLSNLSENLANRVRQTLEVK